MNLRRAALAALGLTVVAAGCGGQDRAALAHQTVQTYWTNVGHMKLHKAYTMLTPGNRNNLRESEYDQNFMGLLKKTQGLSATLGKARVDGNTAVVPVTLHSPVTSAPQPGCQHLYWQNDKWLISDDSGGLSPATECKK